MASLQDVLADLEGQREDLQAQLGRIETAIAALEEIAPAPKKAAKRRAAKPARRRRPVPKRKAPPTGKGYRFVPVCLVHKAVIIHKDGDFTCTMGHVPGECGVKDCQTGEIAPYPTAKQAHKAAANRNQTAKKAAA
jgi:hypothetical protein